MSAHIHHFEQFWTEYTVDKTATWASVGYYYWQCACGEYGYPIPSGSATPAPLGD